MKPLDQRRLGRGSCASVNVETATRIAHTQTMTAKAKTPSDTRRSNWDDAVTYRGIKIMPVRGHRSALSKALRDELRQQAEQKRGEAAKS